MGDETNKLLLEMVQELRAMRRELAALQVEVAPIAEARRSEARMQSPLMGVDFFRQSAEEHRG